LPLRLLTSKRISFHLHTTIADIDAARIALSGRLSYNWPSRDQQASKTALAG